MIRCLSLFFAVLLPAVTAQAERPKIALKAMECRPAELCVRGGPGEQLEPHVARAINKLGFEVMERDAIEALLKESGVSREERDQLCHSEGCLSQLQDALGAMGIDYLVVGRLTVSDDRAELFLTLRRQGSRSNLAKDFVVAPDWRDLTQRIPPVVQSILRPLGDMRAGEPAVAASGAQGPSVKGSAIAADLGWLSLTGQPDGIGVQITGPAGFRRALVVRRGEPWMEQLPPGAYEWKAEGPGLEFEEGRIQVETDETSALNIHLKPPGTLVVTGKPVGAKVAIQGPGKFHSEQGLPVTIEGAPRGKYVVRVSRNSYETEKRKTTVKPGETTTLTIGLVKQADSIKSRQRRKLYAITAGWGLAGALYAGLGFATSTEDKRNTGLIMTGSVMVVGAGAVAWIGTKIVEAGYVAPR